MSSSVYDFIYAECFHHCQFYIANDTIFIIWDKLAIKFWQLSKIAVVYFFIYSQFNLISSGLKLTLDEISQSDVSGYDNYSD